MSLRSPRRSWPLAAVAAALCLLTLGTPVGRVHAQDGVLRVGPTREFAVPSEAAAVARNGDIVEIDAGTYSGDVAIWRANKLTLRGVGEGRPHLRADGNAAEGKAIWVIKGRDTTVENLEFSGAAVADGNGAGIRQEGRNLTVRGSYFHDNQMGLLAGDNPRSTIVIEYSVFSDSRSDSALAHNLYVNGVKRFVLRHSYLHHATIGHNVKSRAKRTEILYNRIIDERDGQSSYSVDIPNAGLAFVIGNVIQQGRESQNSNVLAYGEEGFNHRRNKLFVVHNTFVNDRSSGNFLLVRGEPRVVSLINNIFAGPGTLGDQDGWEMEGNLVRRANPGFVGANRYDYRLRKASDAVDAGVDVSRRLAPRYQYVDIADREARDSDGKPDIGAYER